MTRGDAKRDSGQAFGAEPLAPPAIEMEDRACAYCGSSTTARLFLAEDRLHHGPGQFAVVRCARCGLMRTNPRPTLRSMKAYYPEDYGPYVTTAADSTGPVRKFFRRIADPLDTAIPSVNPGRLLELGSASGNYLVRMQRLGWDVSGIEVDAASAERTANRTGARVLCGDVGSVLIENSQFDLVCGWMVFEHLHDPVLGFRRCYEWLKPGGWLVFSVPDCGSWQFRTFKGNWFALQAPTHLYHFTAPLLSEVLSACGFQHTRIRWQRTLIDVPISLALALEEMCGTVAGARARVAANSLPTRIMARVLGCVAGPLRLTGRLTVWAQKPIG